MTIIITLRMRCSEGCEGAVVAGIYDLVDLTILFFIVQIVNLFVVYIPTISLTVHVSTMSSQGASSLFALVTQQYRPELTIATSLHKRNSIQQNCKETTK